MRHPLPEAKRRSRRTAAKAEAAFGLLGLAARAGAVAAGTEPVRDAVRRGRARLVVLAADVSHNTRDKLVPLLESRGVPYIETWDRQRLGAVIGRGATAAVAVLDEAFAHRLTALLGGQGADEK